MELLRTRLPLPLLLAASLAATLAPAPARALTLFDDQLSLDPAPARQAGVQEGAPAAATPPEGGAAQPELEPAKADLHAKRRSSEAASSMDFDLLGAGKPPPPVEDDVSARRRRSMLNLHQGIGIGLVGLQLATTVTGQLNYNDKFGVANTDRYKLTHKALSYTTLGVFALNGAIALFAPAPKGPKRPGVDRVTIHKIGMAVAALGMVSQGVLGAYTVRREGYLDQQSFGRAHLAIGYVTLAAVSVAVGAIVF